MIVSRWCSCLKTFLTKFSLAIAKKPPSFELMHVFEYDLVIVFKYAYESVLGIPHELG